jgi:hypothetical protein
MAKIATLERGIWTGREIRTRFFFALAFQGIIPDLAGRVLENLAVC